MNNKGFFKRHMTCSQMVSRSRYQTLFKMYINALKGIYINTLLSAMCEKQPISDTFFFTILLETFPTQVRVSPPSVQSLSHVLLFVTPSTAACQASLSITNSQSLLKLMSIDAIQSSHPLSSPSPPTFNISQHQGVFK